LAQNERNIFSYNTLQATVRTQASTKSLARRDKSTGNPQPHAEITAQRFSWHFAAKMAVAGILLGLLASFALMRLLASMLFEVKPADPMIFAGVSVLLLVVTLLACYIPARRAMRGDPMVALHYE
jgi:hypothetical protein